MEEASRRRRRRERVQGQAFMDIARDAYVRWVALECWREAEDLCEARGLPRAEALAEIGRFETREPYAALWRARWDDAVPAARDGDRGVLFAAIEQAVRAALADEEAARRERGDRPLDEDPRYKRFVDHAIERLLAEAAAEHGTG